LLLADREPQSPGEWEQWLTATRKAYRKEAIAAGEDKARRTNPPHSVSFTPIVGVGMSPSPTGGPAHLLPSPDPLGLLEPGAVKVARRVLRGPRRSNAPGLPDEVEGTKKQGAAYGYTKVLGYHPILATRADTGEVLHARMRKGSANTARGAHRFIDELVARVRRAGATGEIVMRFDSGFWSNDTIADLGRLDVRYTMAVRTSVPAVAAAIATIATDAWVDIDYTPDGAAQVAACDYKGRRLIVRRTRLIGRQAKLWPDWRHFGFLTDLVGTPVEVDAFHRRHAVVELAIRDLKEGAGMEHVPSGNFSANSAWLQCAVLAHNLIRWAATIGVAPTEHATVARTVRTRLIAVPARLVNLAGTMTLRGPLAWPWAEWFLRRLECLRGLRLSTA